VGLGTTTGVEDDDGSLPAASREAASVVVGSGMATGVRDDNGGWGRQRGHCRRRRG
jgi:hypothetical protein